MFDIVSYYQVFASCVGAFVFAVLMIDHKMCRNEERRGEPIAKARAKAAATN